MSDETRWREQRGLDADTQRLQSRPRLEAELGGEQADRPKLAHHVGVLAERRPAPQPERLAREPARLPRFAAY